MCVQLSSSTHACLKGSAQWQFADCGMRHIKGKGTMNTYMAQVGCIGCRVLRSGGVPAPGSQAPEG
jgi:hypothetical protein